MSTRVSPGKRIARSAGLTVFLATGLLLGALVVTRLGSGLGSIQAIAVATSTFAGVVVCFAMLVDAVDLWMLGRRMTPYSQKMIHSLVFVAVLAALGLSIVGRNSLLLLFMAPALIIYYFIVRKPVPATTARGRSTRRPSGAARTGSSGSRQKRGGKKRR